jgi:hypothetical protein
MRGRGMLGARMCSLASSPDPVGEGGASRFQCEAGRRSSRPVARTLRIIEMSHLLGIASPGMHLLFEDVVPIRARPGPHTLEPCRFRRLGLRHAADRCAAAG